MTKTVTPPATRCGYPVAEAAAQIGVARDQTFKLIAAGKLRSFRVGRRRLVSQEAIQEFIRAAEAAEAAAATTKPPKVLSAATEPPTPPRNRRRGDVQAA